MKKQDNRTILRKMSELKRMVEDDIYRIGVKAVLQGRRDRLGFRARPRFEKKHLYEISRRTDIDDILDSRILVYLDDNGEIKTLAPLTAMPQTGRLGQGRLFDLRM